MLPPTLEGNWVMAAGSPVSSNNLPATATQRGNVLRGVHVPNVSNPPTQAEVNALLTSLRNAGIIASS
jgi:hypothetical protein